MRAVFAIAGREIYAHQRILAATAAAGFLPLLLPWFLADSNADEVRGVLLITMLVGFLLPQGLLGASSAIGRELAERRLGFYFARPVSGLAIWAGKLGGIIGIGVLGFPLLVLPTLLATSAIPRSEWPAVSGIALLGFAAAVAIGHALGIALRSRSNWLLLDIIAPATLGYIAWYGLWPLFRGFPDTTTEAFLLLTPVLASAMALVVGGALAVVRARTDIRRAHRILSLTTWTGSAIAVGSLVLYTQWGLRLGPAELTRIYWASTAPAGNLVALSGSGPGPWGGSFLVNLSSLTAGRADGSSDAAPRSGAVFTRTGNSLTFSADGSTAAWIDDIENHRPTTPHLVYARMAGGGIERTDTHLMFEHPGWIRLYLSPDGSRLVLFRNNDVSVLDLASQNALFEARLSTDYTSEIRFAVFTSPDRVRFWRAVRMRAASAADGIWELDITRRTIERVAPLPAIPFIARSSANGARVLKNSRDDGAWRLELLDGGTGARVWSRSNRESRQTLSGRLLADGRALVGEVRADEGWLSLISPAGEELWSVPLGVTKAVHIGSEIDAGIVAIGVRPEYSLHDHPGTALMVDLTDGAIVRREAGLTPANAPTLGAQPGSIGTGLASQLFHGPGETLFLLDPRTWRRTALFGPAS